MNAQVIVETLLSALVTVLVGIMLDVRANTHKTAKLVTALTAWAQSKGFKLDDWKQEAV